MKPKLFTERGQALVIIALMVIGLFGIVALAIDGSAKFSDRRHAQNAADTATMAAALERATALRDGVSNNSPTTGSPTTCPPPAGVLPSPVCVALLTAGLNRADSNGYDNNLVTNEVDIHNPPVSGIYSDCTSTLFNCNNYIQVNITSHVTTYFARVIGIEQTHNIVSSVAIGGQSSSSGIPYDPKIFRGVWAGATGGCDPQDYFLWGGSNYAVNGGIHSNADMQIGGSGSSVNGTSTVVDSLILSGSAAFSPALQPATNAPISDPFATAYTFSSFNTGGVIYNAASAVNRIVITSQKIDAGWLKDHCSMDGVACLSSGGVLQDGIYVTTSTEQSGFDLGDSDIHGDGGVGDFANVTLVSDQGGIKLSGSTNKFYPYIGNADATGSTSFLQGLHGILVATWGHGPNTCKDFILSTGGSNAQYGGFLYAPNGQVELNGSNETIVGCVMGNTIKLNGSNSTITCDDTWFPPISYSIGIMQ